ncbi:hypothetical protein ACWCRD_05515 [Streptomyces sp. NPDC002092]
MTASTVLGCIASVAAMEMKTVTIRLRADAAWLAIREFARLNDYRLEAEVKDAQALVLGVRAYEIELPASARTLSSWWEPVGTA